MPDRGVLYFVWGDKHERFLERSIASVKKHHPELPISIHRLGDRADLLDKASMADVTPFDNTLFLDVDTVVLGSLEYGFQKSEDHSLACCICEAPWARRYPSIRGDVVEFNTGVLFFTKDALPLFDGWKERVRAIDSSITMYDGKGGTVRMECNDQAGFAKAVHDLRFNPFVLPLNWNYRPLWQKTFWGPIRIWHDYRPVPASMIELNHDQERDDAILRYTAVN